MLNTESVGTIYCFSRIIAFVSFNILCTNPRVYIRQMEYSSRFTTLEHIRDLSAIPYPCPLVLALLCLVNTCAYNDDSIFDDLTRRARTCSLDVLTDD